MRRIKHAIKMTIFVLALVVLATVNSCDSQSPNTRWIDDFSVALFRPYPEHPYEVFDHWVTGEYPDHDDDIYEAAHEYVVQILFIGEPRDVPGIRVDVEVVDHGDMDIGRDIWPEYGHIAVTTPDGWKIDNLDTGDGALTGRTNASGQCRIAAVYTKDEDAFLDENWVPYTGALLPNDWITTWVELKISIIKKAEPMKEIYVWSTFQRVTDQHFWGQSGPPPVEGVIDISPSGIGHWMEGSMMNESFDSNPLSPVDLPSDNSFAPVLPKGKMSNYSPPASVLRGAGQKSSAAPKYDSTSGITVDWLEWDQFVYKYGYWDWAGNFGIPVDWYLVWFETDDPNEIRMIMDSSQPYCLWSQVTLAQPAEPHITTTVVRSIDPNSETASQMYLFNYPYSTSDNITYIIYSNFLILVDNTEDQGYYYDSWGNLYTVIYVPIEGYIRVDGSNRDFNLDGKINWSDFTLLAEHWQQDCTDPNSSYDGFFEDPNNLEGVIGLGSLRWFSGIWLEDPVYPDPGGPAEPNSGM